MAIKVGKRGDTLIEVMLAVGIFSMVAVAVVSVMSGGSSSSQTALEATLAREEIDNQAETLRFIHRAYIADVEAGGSSKFYNLWKEITDLAIKPNSPTDFSYASYSPQTCKELYDTSGAGGEAYQHGFVLDPRGLVDYETNTDATGNVLYQYKNNLNKFREASTYPHLIYGSASTNKTELDNNLIDHSTDTSSLAGHLYSAEGIYLIAVRDPDSTQLVGAGAGDSADKASAYYDFYIRTCWYGTGDQSPSSISTVIRLYNPDIARENS